MSNIQLIRIVKPSMNICNGKVCMEEKVETLCVKFTDDNGDEVSLAFDGHNNKNSHGFGMISETHSYLYDCPVRSDTNKGGPPKDVVRVLRDELTKLLGEDYPKCIECEETINGLHHPNCSKRTINCANVVPDDCEEEED